MSILKFTYSNKINYIATFLTFIGFWAGMELITISGFISLSRYYTVPLRLFVASIMLFYIIKRSNSRIAVTQYIYPFLIFWLFYFLAIVREYFHPSPYLIFTPIEYFAFTILYAIIPFIFYSFPKDNGTYYIILKALIHSGIILSVFTIIIYGKFLFMGVGRLSNIKYMGIGEEAVISPLALSYSSSIVITIILSRLLFQKNNSKQTIILVIIALLNTVPFLLGSSRGSIIAMIVSLLFIIGFSTKNIAKIKYLIILVVIIFIGIYLSNQFGINMFDRLINSFKDVEGDASNVERLSQWLSAWNQFLSSPLFGDSIQCNIPPYPHNIFLEVLMALGVVGMIPFLILFYFAFRKAVHIIKYKPEYGWIIILFLHGFTMNLISGAIYSSIILWGGMGLIFSVDKYGRKYI